MIYKATGSNGRRKSIQNDHEMRAANANSVDCVLNVDGKSSILEIFIHRRFSNKGAVSIYCGRVTYFAHLLGRGGCEGMLPFESIAYSRVRAVTVL